MFADAFEKAMQFTRPLIIAWRSVSGAITANVGTYVVVNRDGWFLTADHMRQKIDALTTSAQATRDHEAAVALIEGGELNANEKRKAILKLGKLGADAVDRVSIWWGRDGLGFNALHGIPDADLAVGNFAHFDPAWVSEYPEFRDPTKPVRQGTSLCRIGFPFSQMGIVYNAATTSFEFSQLALPPFPIDGILSRELFVSDNPSGYKNMWIETSSPGLQGQSGGPIVDQHGTIWGIQCHTTSLSLGFDPEIPKTATRGNCNNWREHQFLNVGRGAHPVTIVGLLNEKGVVHSIRP